MWGRSRLEESARGRLEGSQLRARAGLADENTAEALEWQAARRTDMEPGFSRYKTAFMASLDEEAGV